MRVSKSAGLSAFQCDVRKVLTFPQWALGMLEMGTSQDWASPGCFLESKEWRPWYISFNTFQASPIFWESPIATAMASDHRISKIVRALKTPSRLGGLHGIVGPHLGDLFTMGKSSPTWRMFRHGTWKPAETFWNRKSSTKCWLFPIDGLLMNTYPCCLWKSGMFIIVYW